MFEYLLNISPSNRSAEIDPEMEGLIKSAIVDTNKSTNNIRNKRFFSWVKRIDGKTVQVKLSSESSVSNPTGTLSSITRALIRICSPDNLEKLQPLVYNNTYLVATQAAEEERPLTPLLTVQTVCEIFFARETLCEADQKEAEKAAAEIRKSVEKYLKATKKS